jgi:hypothetical protein
MKSENSESKALEALLWLYDNGAGEFFTSVAMRAQGVTNVNEIPAEQGKTTQDHPTVAALAAVDWFCPKCGKSQIFSMTDTHVHDGRSICVAKSTCTGCEQRVYFWAMLSGNQVLHLAMHPVSRRARPAIKYMRSLPDRYRGLYEQAHHNFMVGNWDACLAMCRKLVEGALKEATGTMDINLKTEVRIARFAGSGGWAETMQRKLQILSGVGHLGVHFDKIEPTYAMATQVMDSTENLLSMVYLWPAAVDDLEHLLQSARDDAAGQMAEGE